MKKQYEQNGEEPMSIDQTLGPQVLDMKNYMKQGTDKKEHQTLANGINALVASYAMVQKAMEQYGIKDPMIRGAINAEIGKGYLGLAKQLSRDGKYSVASTMYGVLAEMYLRTAEVDMKRKEPKYAV